MCAFVHLKFCSSNPGSCEGHQFHLTFCTVTSLFFIIIINVLSLSLSSIASTYIYIYIVLLSTRTYTLNAQYRQQ